MKSLYSYESNFLWTRTVTKDVIIPLTNPLTRPPVHVYLVCNISFRVLASHHTTPAPPQKPCHSGISLPSLIFIVAGILRPEPPAALEHEGIHLFLDLILYIFGSVSEHRNRTGWVQKGGGVLYDHRCT